jgi:Rieske 2Fe-2S family protein
MFDYKHYESDIQEWYVWVEAPLRDKPSSNRLERAYARLARPMPGLSDADSRSWRYVFIYPNTTIDLYPDQVNTWQMRPDGIDLTRDTFGNYRPANSGARTRFVQWANQRLNTIVLNEDIDLVENVQRGLQTRGYRCGPLSAQERAVGWFADRIRADLAPALNGS